MYHQGTHSQRITPFCATAISADFAYLLLHSAVGALTFFCSYSPRSQDISILPVSDCENVYPQFAKILTVADHKDTHPAVSVQMAVYRSKDPLVSDDCMCFECRK